MSYDLVFWRQARPSALKPVEIYDKVNSRENIEGRAELPDLADLLVDEILARLKDAYPNFDPAEQFPSFTTAEGTFNVAWSKKHFLFMIYADLGDTVNPLVRAMADFGCPMYDPQENRRYDADGGTAVAESPPFVSPTPEEKLAKKQMIEQFVNEMTRSIERSRRRRRIVAACVAAAVIVIILLIIL